MDRREFLRLSALATTGAALGAGLPGAAFADEVEGATIAELQAAMAAGHLTAVALVQRYVDRIERLDRHGPHVNSVIELNPDAHAIAEQLDRERRQRGARGPLHGIPI